MTYRLRFRVQRLQKCIKPSGFARYFSSLFSNAGKLLIKITNCFFCSGQRTTNTANQSIQKLYSKLIRPNQVYKITQRHEEKNGAFSSRTYVTFFPLLVTFLSPRCKKNGSPHSEILNVILYWFILHSDSISQIISKFCACTSIKCV